MKKTENFTAAVAKRFHIPGNYFKFAEVPAGVVSAQFFYRGLELFEELTDVVAGWSAIPGRLQNVPGFDEVLITSSLTQAVSFYINRGEVGDQVVSGNVLAAPALTTGVAPVGNDAIASLENSFALAVTVGAVAAQMGRLQLWNPNGSGKAVYLDAVDIVEGAAANVGACAYRSAGGALVGGPAAAKSHYVKTVMVSPTAEIRNDTTAGAFPGTPEYGRRNALANTTLEFRFPRPLRIDPNNGVTFQINNQNVAMTGAFYFREY
jgi:hypothetical protein